jgi:hypothetical protein
LIINSFITYSILWLLNLFIPILNKFKPKFIRYSLNNVTLEHKELLQQIPNYYKAKFNIDNYFDEKYNKVFNQLIAKELVYIKDIKTNNYNYQTISYIFNIIESAKKAITELEEVSKDNRKIAYYEKNSSASLDDLVKEYTKLLEEQGYKKLSLTASKKEIRFKRLLAKLKRDKSLFFNFYLLIFSLNSLEELNVKKEEKDIFELLLNLFEFYRVGHATNQQIYKSVAIQIYDIYKNEFEEKELQEIISILITACFNLDENYSNFNKIGEQKVYIKNLVYNFPLFEHNTKLAKEQKKQIFRFLATTKNLFPIFIPNFLKRKYVHYYFNDLLEYYYKMDSLNFFGFSPKKK